MSGSPSDTTTIPALTVWQPWASLIQAGCKPYEFRGWAAPRALRGRRIAIHAGARPIRRAEVQDLILGLRTDGGVGTALVVEPALALLDRVLASPGAFALSHVLCTATLGEPIRATDLAAERPDLADSDRIDQCIWGWPLDAIEAFEPPVPARGAQGFWPWSQGAANA